MHIGEGFESLAQIEKTDSSADSNVRHKFSILHNLQYKMTEELTFKNACRKSKKTSRSSFPKQNFPTLDRHFPVVCIPITYACMHGM